MKILKIVGLILLGLLVVFLVVGLFLPSQYTVSKTTEINVPVDSVYNYVVTFKDREQWDPWIELDPAAESKIEDGKWSWNGEIIGKGELSIIEKEQNKMIKSQLKFISPQEIASDIYWHFDVIDSNTTKVKWSNEGDLDYPMGRYYGLFIEDLLGNSFQTGLKNLKSELEK